MGNAPSTSKKRTQWDWEYKNGRMQPKARVAHRPQRPLFKKQPTNNYDWWIFNPNAKKKRSGR